MRWFSSRVLCPPAWYTAHPLHWVRGLGAVRTLLRARVRPHPRRPGAAYLIHPSTRSSNWREKVLNTMG